MVLYHVVRPLGPVSPQRLTWCQSPSRLTPVVVVIFRFNDPDAFLTLLLMLATCAYWHALESGKTGQLVLSGVLLGVAFLTKSLEAFLVVPAFGVVSMYAADRLTWLGAFASSAGQHRRSRARAGGGSLSSAYGRRTRVPNIGGSADNSGSNLIFEYNGFSRIAGSGRTSSVRRRRPRAVTDVRLRVWRPDLLVPSPRPCGCRRWPLADSGTRND